MKRLSAILLLIFLFQCLASSQEMSMNLRGTVEHAIADLDAKTYYPVTDQNDNLCALLKVTVTNRLQNELVLSTGGLSVVKREEKSDGEIWFYVPYQVKNLTFTCKGYSRMAPVPVNLKAGEVYRLTIATDAAVSTVMTATVSSNYLKMKVYPEDALLSLGRTSDCEITTEVLSDGTFARLLDYGTYYYRIEHSLYETETGTVEVSGSNDVRQVSLRPAYNTLTVLSAPDAGADVFINGERMGTTPLTLDEKLKKGRYALRLVLRDYEPYEDTVLLTGDGTRITRSAVLNPLYAIVTVRSDDSQAQIWVDKEYKGTGSWTGRLSGEVTHVVESRRESHQPQSRSVTVEAGETGRIIEVPAPVPLYATLNIETDPVMAEVQIDGKNVGTAPLVEQVLIGKRTVSASMSGYETETATVELQHNETKTVTISLQEKPAYTPPASSSYSSAYTPAPYKSTPSSSYSSGSGYRKTRYRYPNYQDDFAATFADIVCGYGLYRENFHIGMTYAHVRTRIGYYGTLLYEFDDVGSLAVGPVFRLTSDRSNVDLQLYGGIGVNTGSNGTFLLGDAGFRFGWHSRSRLSWWDFGIGCMYFNDEILPTVSVGIGISLVVLAGILGLAAGA